MSEIYCPTVLKAESPKSRCRQCWLFLRAEREGSVTGFSPWLIDGCLLLVSLHAIYLGLFGNLLFLSFIRTRVILDWTDLVFT